MSPADFALTRAERALLERIAEAYSHGPQTLAVPPGKATTIAARLVALGLAHHDGGGRYRIAQDGLLLLSRGER